MKRCILRICVLLVLGAIVNVAVAWVGFRITDGRGFQRCVLIDRWVPMNESARRLWARHASDGWPEPTDRFRSWHGWFASGWSMGLSVSGSYVIRLDATDDELREIYRGSGSFDVEQFDSGFPLGSMRLERWYGNPDTRWFPATAGDDGLVLAGHAFPKRVLPVRFAINTVFYAFILWLLFAAPFALRKRQARPVPEVRLRPARGRQRFKGLPRVRHGGESNGVGSQAMSARPAGNPTTSSDVFGSVMWSAFGAGCAWTAYAGAMVFVVGKYEHMLGGPSVTFLVMLAALIAILPAIGIGAFVAQILQRRVIAAHLTPLYSISFLSGVFGLAVTGALTGALSTAQPVRWWEGLCMLTLATALVEWCAIAVAIKCRILQPVGPHVCANCGYDLRGSKTDTCPERGATVCQTRLSGRP